jgi:ZIP family zinc transporter
MIEKKTVENSLTPEVKKDNQWALEYWCQCGMKFRTEVISISNLPEAIAGTVGMKAGGVGRGKILALWCVIALVCAMASAAGFVLFGDISANWIAFVQAFAGGAILMMLANSMFPEAYEHGGKLAGVFTVLGFCASVTIIVFEHSQGF